MFRTHFHAIYLSLIVFVYMFEQETIMNIQQSVMNMNNFFDAKQNITNFFSDEKKNSLLEFVCKNEEYSFTMPAVQFFKTINEAQNFHEVEQTILDFRIHAQEILIKEAYGILSPIYLAPLVKFLQEIYPQFTEKSK